MSVELTRAEPFAAPVVESHSVRLLVDSFYDRFIEDAGHPLVKIEHVRHIPGHKRSTFAGEWGLSLHLESAQAGGKSRYLLDFGYTPEVLIRNFELLDLDPSRIDGLILSHGHRDHYGGLEGFVTHYRAKSARISGSSPAERPTFARSGSNGAAPNGCPRVRSTARRWRPPPSIWCAVKPRMRFAARLRLAPSSAR